MTVDQLIEKFLAHVKAEHAPATLRAYEGRLVQFARVFGLRELSDLKREEIEDYLKQKETLPDGRGAAPDTIRLQVVSVEQLQKHALTIGALAAPIVPRLPRPGGRRRERIPTRREQAAILREAKKRHRVLATIFRALWQCGARPGELARAKIEEYDRGPSVIVLAEHKTAKKTRRTRRIGVGRKLKRIVMREIGDRRSGPIFRTKTGKGWTPGGISRGFSQIRDALGYSKDLVLYSLRHSYGTRICRKFGIHAAATALGHTNVGTSQRYVHLGDDVLTEYQDGIK